MLFRNKQKKINYFVLYLAFLLPLLLVNIPVVVQMKMLRMGSDEYNILSIAAYISGVDWSSYNASINAYHGFGGSIFYIPLFLLFDNAMLIYKLALIENIFLLAIIPLISFYIMTHYFNIKNIIAFGVSICISLYPYYLVSNKHTWSENAVIIFTWLNLLLMLKVVEHIGNKYSFIWQLLYICAAGYSYMVHGRCIVYVAVAPLVISLTYFRHSHKKEKLKNIAKCLVLLAVLLCFYFFNSGIINYFKDYLWQADELRNTMETLAEDRLSYFTNIQNIKNMIKMAFGQFFYMYIATMGIAFLAFVLMGTEIVGYFKNKEERVGSRIYIIVAAYTFLVYIGSLTISILGLISGVTVGNRRKDYVIWGRHTEPLFPILVMIAVIYCLNNKIVQKHIRMWKVCVVSMIFGFLRLAFPLMISMPNNGHSSIVSILLWLKWEFFFFSAEETFFRVMDVILLVSVLALVLVWLLYKKKIVLFSIMFMIQSLVSFVYVSDVVTLKTANSAYERVVGVQEFVNENDINCDLVFYLSNEKRYPSEMQIIFYNSEFSLLYDPMNPRDVNWEKLDTDNSFLIVDTNYFEQLYSTGIFDDVVYDEAFYINVKGNKTIIGFDNIEIKKIDCDIWEVKTLRKRKSTK